MAPSPSSSNFAKINTAGSTTSSKHSIFETHSVCSSRSSSVINHKLNDDNNSIYLKDPTAFTALTKIHKKAVLDCCFSPDTNQILTSSEDNSVVLWNLPDHDVELHDETINDEHKIVCYRLSDHKMPVMSVTMNEFFFISASKDGQAKLWRLSLDQAAGSQFKCPLPEPITYNCHTKILSSVSISPFSMCFATGSYDKSIKIWSTSCRNKLILSLLDGHTNWVKCVKWSKLSDNLLASCGDDSKICLWDTRTKVRQPPFLIIPARKSMQLNCLDWHPVFEHHIVTGSQDASCVVWDIRNKKQVQTYIEHSAAINSVAFSNSGSLLLTGSQDKTSRIFDVCEGKNPFTLKSHNGSVTSVCFNNDDELFATSSIDKSTTIWKKNFETPNIELVNDENTSILNEDFAPPGSIGSQENGNDLFNSTLVPSA